MQRTTHKHPFIGTTFACGVITIGAVLAIALAGGQAQAATATATTIKKAPSPAAAFCAQVTSSQAAIRKALGDAKTKLGSITAEWTKIEGVAPFTVKADVTTVKAAYAKAASVGSEAAVNTPAVSAAGKKITSFFTANCTAGGGSGAQAGGPEGDGGPGGGAFTAYRDCLTKNGVTLPARGGPGGGAGGSAGNGAGNGGVGGARASTIPGATRPPRGAGGGGPTFGLDPSDPKIAKALAACKSLQPTGGFGGPDGGGRGGGRRFDSPALQACLKKKGVTLPAAGGSGGNVDGPPTFDAKTQAAMQSCIQEVGNATATTIK